MDNSQLSNVSNLAVFTAFMFGVYGTMHIHTKKNIFLLSAIFFLTLFSLQIVLMEGLGNVNKNNAKGVHLSSSESERELGYPCVVSPTLQSGEIGTQNKILDQMERARAIHRIRSAEEYRQNPTKDSGPQLLDVPGQPCIYQPNIP